MTITLYQGNQLVDITRVQSSREYKWIKHAQKKTKKIYLTNLQKGKGNSPIRKLYTCTDIYETMQPRWAVRSPEHTSCSHLSPGSLLIESTSQKKYQPTHRFASPCQQFLTMAFHLTCVPVNSPSPACHAFNCFPALTPHLAPTPITLLKATCLLATPPRLCLVQGKSVLFHESSFKILTVPLFCSRGNGDLERLGNLLQVTS